MAENANLSRLAYAIWEAAGRKDHEEPEDFRRHAQAALDFLGFDPDHPPAEGAMTKAVEALEVDAPGCALRILRGEE